MSEPEPDLAALRRAFAALPPVPPAPESCPPAESILAAVRGELPPAELRDVIAHLAACPACAEDWRLAVALEQPMAEDPAAEASPETTPWRARKSRLTVWFASAAAAAALLVSGLLWRMPDPTSGMRGGSQTIQLTHVDTVSRKACLLRWTKVPDATTYDLKVVVQDGPPVEQVRGLTEPQHQVPTFLLKDIPAGAAVTWRVTAHLRNGQHLASPLDTFVLR